jgi:hypothetical protein
MMRCLRTSLCSDLNRTYQSSHAVPRVGACCTVVKRCSCCPLETGSCKPPCRRAPAHGAPPTAARGLRLFGEHDGGPASCDGCMGDSKAITLHRAMAALRIPLKRAAGADGGWAQPCPGCLGVLVIHWMRASSFALSECSTTIEPSSRRFRKRGPVT